MTPPNGRASKRDSKRFDGTGPSRARWPQAILALFVVLGSALPAHATHFRYGNLTWQPVSGRTVNFNLTDAFRRSTPGTLDPCVNPNSAPPYTTIACTGPGGGHGVGDVIREDIGGTQLDFGDGTHTPTGTTPLLYKVTSIDVTNNWSFVAALDPAKLGICAGGANAGASCTVNSQCPGSQCGTQSTDIAHTYASGNRCSGGSNEGAACTVASQCSGGGTCTNTTYKAKVDDCCRISASTAPNGHINNPDKQYTLSTNVTFAGNSCPVSIQVPIVNCEINSICTFSVPASDANGDTLH